MFIDCFPYFNEEELLELRIRSLERYVDKFVIVEADRTHRGDRKAFTCEETILKLGLPKEKILLLLVNLPSKDENFDPWVRERGQRNAISYIFDKFPVDTTYFISDCDEILDPIKIPNILQTLSAKPDMIVHAPMVFLMGRADLRAYQPDKKAYLWTAGYFGSGNVLQNANLSAIREQGGTYFYKDDQIVDKSVFDDPIERDAGVCGWHFSWMGDNQRRKLKCQSFVHCYDNIHTAVAPLASDKMEKFMNNYVPNEGSTDPLGRSDHILHYYPPELLPDEVFKLNRVKNYLLPHGRQNAARAAGTF